MEITRNVQGGNIEVWLSKEERDDAALRTALKSHYKQWKAEGYLPVVYLSGREDLYDETLALLKHNRKLSALENI